MAIFASKKDRRRQNQGGAGMAPKETVHIEVPDRHGNANDGVLTKATISAARTQQATGETTDDPKRGAQTNGTPATTSPSASVAESGAADAVASPPADGTSAPAADRPVAAESAAAAPEIEPVDIEPEVIEAPAEPPLVFGIADAIRLMHSLPADPNIELVVRVVRVTLGAVNVSVDDILRDAERKELKVRESIAALENEVTALEMALHEKRAAIATHQADLRETATVRERLHMADKYTAHPPPLPPDAVRATPKPRDWDRFDADHPFKTKDS